jgi:RluA family pseudouridine synthase
VKTLIDFAPHTQGPFGELFSEPFSDPPVAAPPFGGRDPIRVGDIPESLSGQPSWKLAQLLTGLNDERSKELVAFGSLWLNDSVNLDPLAAIGKGCFRLSLPVYGTGVFYEINRERIVYRDDDVIVYDKEADRPSQAVPYDAHNNVLAAMERYTGLTLRLAHRLDAGTSGLLLLAVNRLASSRLGIAFQSGKVSKRYLALSLGPKPDWTEKTVEAVIAKENGRYLARESGPGLKSITKFTVIDERDGVVLFLAQPLTGRTHQIRLHLAFIGRPIVGDQRYGGKKDVRIMLRACGLSFSHPGTGEKMIFGGPWP